MVLTCHCKRKMQCHSLRGDLVAGTLLLATVLMFCSSAVAVNTDCEAIKKLGTAFECASGDRCINLSRVCDGPNDCLDWSDELNCNQTKCGSHQFKCNENNNCINDAWRCDGDEDCSDGSDERGCPKRSCADDQFECTNGRCVPLYYKCDGDNDCNDNSDEPDSCPPLTCRAYQFKCQLEDTCISNNWVCDNENDCKDGSDERNCSTINVISCTIGKFDCGDNSNGSNRCIEYSWVCDGESDCTNNADEELCDPENRVELCHDGQFACSSGQCIPREWHCDGDNDCPSANDEANCEATCGPHQFHCEISGECINGNLVCNGLSDCIDSSDEELNSCSDIIQPVISCNPNMFQCSDLSRCLTGDQHCDNRSQCADSSDEHNCSHSIANECQGDNGGCVQLCHDTPASYFCSCRHGYKINPDRRSCDDIDECSVKTPCSQLCHNTIGSYYCSCIDGFVSDGPYCINSSDGEAWLLYSDRYNLWHISTDDNHKNKTLIEMLDYPLSMDYHYRLGYVFWTDYGMKKIQRSYLNGSGPITTVIGHGLEQPTGITVDWINDKIYWTDGLTKVIEVSNLDGSNRLALVWSDLELPRPIVLDPLNRHMYWSDWGVNARIEMASMDGSNRVVLHATRLVWPNALSIDLISERLYWADAKLHVIESSHLDGSHRQVIAEELLHPFAMTLFGQYLYYTDWQLGGILRVNKLIDSSSNSTKVLLKTDSIISMGIKAVHPSLQQHGDNPCNINNGGCSHLCLLSSTSLGHSTCACPTGHRIDSNKKRCLPIDKYLLFARSVDIKRISFDTPSFVDVTLPLTGLEHTIGLDWSGSRNTVYWCEYLTGTISMATLEGNDQRVLVNDKGSQPVGLAVDWITDKLYWTDAKKDRIEVLDLSNSKRTVLISTGLDQPRGIAVHPTRGLMFWTDWGYDAKIERANMDGTGRLVLVNTSITWPNGITIDYDRELVYWVDAGNITHGIEYCDFNGNGRVVLINQMVLHPFGIILYKDHIYWTDWRTNKVERADKITGANRIVVHSNLGKLMDVTVVHNDRATVTNPCAVNNGGCSYMCLLRPAAVNGVQSSCVCPTGISLVDDKTCASRIQDYVLFSTYSDLRKVSLDVPNPIDEHINVSAVTNLVSIAIDHITEDVFLSDINYHKILRYSQATGETREIPRLGSIRSEGVAVDWLSKQVYWTDIDSRTIEVSDYSGEVRMLLLTREDGLSGPRAITLDLKNKYLFFVDWQRDSSSDSTSAVIKRSQLDGSDLRTIVNSTDAGSPIDIVVDYQGGFTRLYWTDSNSKPLANRKAIISVNIDGRHRRVLLDDMDSFPNGLSIMSGRIFWTYLGSSKIISADKITGSNQKIEYDIKSHIIGNIHVFTSNSTIPSSNYPCRHGAHPCSHLCLPKRSHRGYRCACATGVRVSEDSTCSSAAQDFIVYAESTSGGKKGSLQRIPVGATSAYQTTLLPDIQNPVALEYYHIDNLNGYVFWSDPAHRYIGRVSFDGSNSVIIVSNVSTDSLAVDWVSGNLYWIDYQVMFNQTTREYSLINFTISVSRLDGRYRKKLITSELGYPRCIAVLPKLGKIFWNDHQNCRARIESANMDGSGKQVVVELDEDYEKCQNSCREGECLERFTNQMELNYTSNELYWVDGNQDKLESVGIDGSNYRAVNNISYGFGLGLDVNDVYTTSWIKTFQGYSLWKWHNSPESAFKPLRNDITGKPMDVAVVRRDKRPSGVDDLNACAVNNGGCPYLCLPVNQTHRRCACPDELGEPCTESVSVAPSPTQAPSSVAMTTSSSNDGVVVTETSTSDDITVTPTAPTSTTSGSSQSDNDGELTGRLEITAYAVLGAMLVVLFIAMLLVILCVVRRRFPERFSSGQSGRRRSSILAVYGRFRSKKLPEEASNGWSEKPNNFIAQLPTTKQLQLSVPLGGPCTPSSMAHKNIVTKDSDTLFPKKVNVEAPTNIDPGTPPSPDSPLSPSDEAALVRIEQHKVVFESKI